ncbi:MAG: hypothetical protein A3K75_05345 [Euryarchaeota archaeon RBG_13_61_15]|nr:MAG: hypothetical protein A3K75_05345 [Euryarchaeota archaeon RBG_13_61_15]
METALILCEDGFGRTRGKTAAGLVRHSLRFKIVGVVDSKTAGKDAGEVLDGKKNGIMIYASVEEALSKQKKPDWIIVGVATIGGMLPPEFREPLKAAIKSGVSVLSGLHEWLGQDPELRALADKHKVKIVDIRKEPPLPEMHYFKNLAGKLNAVRIPILGTDAACGKRTTGVILTQELNKRGIKTAFVATGQTGLLQGSRYGIPLDAIRGDYVVGELENAIVSAYEGEHPQVIIVEGQGALSHPAYVAGSRAIVNASQPTTVVLQHAPGRKYRSYHADELHLPNGTIDREMELIKVYAKSDVIGITLNHENMTRKEVEEKISEYEKKYGLPCCDVLVDGPGKIADAIIKRYFSKKS